MMKFWAKLDIWHCKSLEEQNSYSNKKLLNSFWDEFDLIVTKDSCSVKANIFPCIKQFLFCFDTAFAQILAKAPKITKS